MNGAVIFTAMMTTPRKSSVITARLIPIARLAMPNFSKSINIRMIHFSNSINKVPRFALVQAELFLPVFSLQPLRLVLLLEYEIFQRQHVDAGAHETAVRVLGRADNWLAAHVETCVHQHGAPGQPFEFGQQAVDARVP